MRRRFGADTVEHIRQMTSYRLERDLLNGALEVPPTLLPPEGAAPAEKPLLTALPQFN